MTRKPFIAIYNSYSLIADRPDLRIQSKHQEGEKKMGENLKKIKKNKKICPYISADARRG